MNLSRFGLTLLLLIGKIKPVNSVTRLTVRQNFGQNLIFVVQIILQVYLLMGDYFRRLREKNSNHLVTLPVSFDRATNIDRRRQNIKPSSSLSPF